MSSSRRLTRQRKQQTRLSFQPLPSSSPAKDSYNSAVQGRLASVRFNGAKSTPTRKTRASANTEDSLPTPEPSSQPQLDPDEESPPSDDETASVSKHLTVKPASPSTSHDSEEDDIVTPSNKRRKIEQDEDDDTPLRRSSRSQGNIATNSSISFRSRNSNITRQVASSPVRKRRSMSIGSPETSGDEEVVLITQPTQRRRSAKPARHDNPFVVSDDEDFAFSEKRQKLPRVKELRQWPSPAGFVVDDDDEDIEYISSESGKETSKPQRRSRQARRPRRSRKEQEELLDDLRDLQGSSNDETEADEANHEDEEEQHQEVTARKTRGAPTTTQRDRARQHLEVLKRRRAGEAIPRITDSNDDFDEFEDYDGADIAEVVHDTIHSKNDDLEEAFSDSDVGARRLRRDSQQADEEDGENDFIVEDGDTEIDSNRRPPPGIPLAFTSWASRKPSELFIHVVEWLVKNKIAPAFNRGDELYDLSWNRINDQIKAQAGSRLISSAWNADFKYTILARPHMRADHIDDGYDDMFQDCDACNRTNHPARYVFRFTGRPYHPDTLEPVDEDADGSEREDNTTDDQGSYDRHGHLLPSTSVAFNLGSHCAANAEMGHKLTHWKHSLNDQLLEYLEEQGALSAEAIVAREKLSKKKREKEAENMIDMMEETGIIRDMWKDLQSNLEDARFGMEDHYARGGKRSKNRIGKVRVNRGEGRIEEWAEGGEMRLIAPSDSEGE